MLTLSASKGTNGSAKNQIIDVTNSNITNLDVTLLGGDSNNDNAVDVTDLLAIINHYNQLQANNPNNFLEGADFNCDGANDVADLLIVINNYNHVGD